MTDEKQSALKHGLVWLAFIVAFYAALIYKHMPLAALIAVAGVLLALRFYRTPER